MQCISLLYQSIYIDPRSLNILLDNTKQMLFFDQFLLYIMALHLESIASQINMNANNKQT